MWKKRILGLVVTTILVLSTISVITTNKAEGSSGTTLYVGGSGPGNYTTIQSAIDNSNNNDTVFVYSGTYYENVFIDNSINLIGMDKNNTIIDGGGTDVVVYVSPDWVNISGFTIQNDGGNGIYLESFSDNNTITGNIITYNWMGIVLSNHSNYNNILGNTLTHNGYGILFSSGSNNNNIITGNTITHNTKEGIRFHYSNRNTIMGNTLTHNNEYGIYLMYSQINTITENTIANHTRRGISLGCSRNNKIYHNNFINNLQHASSDMRESAWDNGYPSGGNYWDDYNGTDDYHGTYQDMLGCDGIGDIPRTIPIFSENSEKDMYPLMHPYNPINTIVEFQAIEPLYTTENIELAISINPIEHIAGVQFDLSFNPDMLSIEWVAEGDIFSECDTYFDPGIIDNTNGSLKNVVSLITTPGRSTTDQGSILVMSIRAKTIPGETSLNLSNVIVGRPEGTSIDVTIINTTVTIYHHDRWDVNWDDRVNIPDLILIGQWWGETGTPCWVSADVNCDGFVNILDMILVGQHWTG